MGGYLAILSALIAIAAFIDTGYAQQRDFGDYGSSFNLGWNDWEDWTECSVTCGEGSQTRSRTCKLHASSGLCGGPSNEERQCQRPSCPVNGGWTDWKQESDCPVTCGEGTIRSTRTCTNPAPQFGGEDCEGSSVRTTNCGTRPCPVNGGWTNWIGSGCSATCGDGSMTSTRTCTNPEPLHGGNPCSGSAEKTEPCKIRSCAVDGSWSGWNAGSCSKTCGTGERRLTRSCTNPRPSNGGSPCSGISVKTEICENDTPCQVNGGWTSWKFSPCSKTCGTGVITQTRSCTNPKPQNGGQVCSGGSQRTETCTVSQGCAADGKWTPWKQGPCSASCGAGTRTLTRTCTAPSNGGRDCAGGARKVESCNLRSCPGNQGWGLWSDWSECSQQCEAGREVRKRKCNFSSSKFGGRKCEGAATEERPCVDFASTPCPDSPEVSIQANRIDGPVGGETRVRNIPQQDF